MLLQRLGATSDEASGTRARPHATNDVASRTCDWVDLLAGETTDRRCAVRSAAGIAIRFGATRAWLEDGGRIRSAPLAPPAGVDLQPLLGKTLRVTQCLAPDGEPLAEETTVSSDDAHVWMIARAGAMRATHQLGETRLRAARSHRPDGALVVGTEALQWVLAPGEEVRVGTYVVHHVARDAAAAMYVIVDARLWRSPPPSAG